MYMNMFRRKEVCLRAHSYLIQFFSINNPLTYRYLDNFKLFKKYLPLYSYNFLLSVLFCTEANESLYLKFMRNCFEIY